MTATSRRSLILDELGGPPLTVAHLPADDRAPGYELVNSLRGLCNSLSRTPSGWQLNENRVSWRCLRDVSPEMIVYTVRLTERSWPAWRLTLQPSDSIYDDLERFLGVT